MADPIRIEGLKQFVSAAKRVESDLPKQLRVALNGAADIVIATARPRVPRRSGRAAASIKARSTQSAVRISAGGNRARYYPWLDFGGRVGVSRSVRRPFLREGRYLWKAYSLRRADVLEEVQRALVGTARAAGMDVT